MLRKLSAVLFAASVVALCTPEANDRDFWGQGVKSWEVGLQLSLPTGNLSDVAGLGFGGFGKFQYGLKDNLMLTGSLGYTYWIGKDQGYGVSTHASTIPLLVGAKYNLSKEVTPGFYAFGEVGFYFESLTVGVSHYNPFTGIYESTTWSESRTEFAVCPGVGYEFQNFDFSAKHAIAGDAGNFALSAAHQLPLN